MGTQVAISDVASAIFGKKGTKPRGMQNFINQMGGEAGDAATTGDSSEMGRMRKRIAAMIAAGEA